MDANSSLGFVLDDAARLLRKRFEQKARGTGLNRSQWQVLAYLDQNEGINQRRLAQLLDVAPITLCRIVDKLETQGLIERYSHPSDRRVWLLRPTAAAPFKLMQVRKLGDIARSEALAGVSAADRDHLLKTLRILKANLMDACDASVAGRKRESHG